ncbi:MAG TPA: hypothetical protein VM146_05285 [Steroidobacteraceae bacterium]|nr:hypothetical protein [Steroidobacteraceae bacterium]
MASYWTIATLVILAVAAPARAAEHQPAMNLSEALCGNLDAGMIEAEGRGHGRFDASAPLKPGRSAEYRRRVASTAAIAGLTTSAQSHLATSAH